MVPEGVELTLQAVYLPVVGEYVVVYELHLVIDILYDRITLLQLRLYQVELADPRFSVFTDGTLLLLQLRDYLAR